MHQPSRRIAAEQGHGTDMGLIEQDAAEFFQLAETLQLTGPEQEALLDLPRHHLNRLRLGRQPPALGRAKLQRRLTYAVSIVRRMLAATAT